MTTVVCICGSTRFRKEIAEANRKLTMEGKIVLAPGVFQHDGDPLTEGQKSFLDDLHLRKIDLADEVYIVNPGGYIGSSTAKENNYAIKTSKPVTYLVELCDKCLRYKGCNADCEDMNCEHCYCYRDGRDG
jgi:hypothetical protein